MIKNDTNPFQNQLNKGVLYSFIPRRLNIQDRPELSDFPYNVMFARYKQEGNKIIMGSVVYNPDFESYNQRASLASMKYLSAYDPQCWLQIDYDKSKKTYRGEKFVNDQSVGLAIGVDWNIFFVHFTALGLANGERCEFKEIS